MNIVHIFGRHADLADWLKRAFVAPGVTVSVADRTIQAGALCIRGVVIDNRESLSRLYHGEFSVGFIDDSFWQHVAAELGQETEHVLRCRMRERL